jgi:creatinine amidohydrolase
VIAWGPATPTAGWPATETAGRPADSHAGRTETSLLLAIAPEVVRLERAEPGVTTPLEMVLPELRRGGLAAVPANGVLGDPTGASATEGRALLDTRAAELARLVSGHLDRATPAGAAT